MYVNQEDSKVRQLGQNIGMTMPKETLKLGRGMMEREKTRKYNMMGGGKVKKYGYMGGGKVYGQPRKATYKAG
jgi:hypothetical protein